MLKMKHCLLFVTALAALVFSVSCFSGNNSLTGQSGLFGFGKSNEKTSDAGYQFIMLTDTHLDDAKYHPERSHYTSVRATMWQGKMQSLIHASASKVNEKTKFVLHGGDLAEDDKAATQEVAVAMLDDAVKMIKAEYGTVPVISVPGNHDKNHKDFFTKYLSAEMKREIANTTFYFMQGPDLFLCIDSNDPDLDVIRKAFAEHADARYKFVMSHAPVIPTDVWESCLFENRPAERKEFRELFLKNDIIALSGHVHSLEFVRCENETGRITQLISSSLWMPQLGLEPQIWICNADNYMKLRSNLGSRARQLLSEYKDIVTEYKVAADRKSDLNHPSIQTSGAGYYVLHVDSNGVTADFYRGDTTKEAEWTIRLR